MYVRLLKSGRGFKGALEYQLGVQTDKPHTILDGNVHGDPELIKEQFYRDANRRPDVKDPVLHLFASFHPQDQPTDDQMREVASRLLESIEFDTTKHQFLVVRHHDTPHQHFHIIGNRVADDGSVFQSKNWPARRLREEAHRLDQEMGFTPVGPNAARGVDIEDELPLGQSGNPRLSRYEQRTGLKSAKNEVYQGVRDAMRASDGSFESYDLELRKLGISPSWSFTKDGQFNGSSFTLLQPGRAAAATNEQGESYTFKGSQIRWAKDQLLESLDKRQQQVARQARQTERKPHKSPDFTVQHIEQERQRILASLTRGSRAILGTNSGLKKRHSQDYSLRLKRSTLRSFLPFFKPAPRNLPYIPMPRKRQ